MATTNLEERKAIYDKIQAILLDDLPFAPIFSYQSIVGVKDRMKGYEVNPYLTSNFWNTRGLDDGLSPSGPWARFLVNRLAQSAVLPVGVSVIGFALMHLAPGGPLAMYTLNPTVTAQDIQRIKVQFGLDQPIWVQYFKWAAGVFTGNWGYSFFGGQPVRDVVFDRLPATFELMGSALCLSLLIGVAIGILSAVKRGSLARPRDGGRGDGGAVAADLLVRPARDLHFRADSGLAAGGRQSQHRAAATLVDAPPASDPSGRRARVRPGRAMESLYALLHARDPQSGLHPHGAGQGAAAESRPRSTTRCGRRSCR